MTLARPNEHSASHHSSPAAASDGRQSQPLLLSDLHPPAVLSEQDIIAYTLEMRGISSQQNENGLIQRPRQEDHLSPGDQDQPGPQSMTPSLQK
ncbi:hypothetical protein AAY473_039268 [Plecturocebus cupreus]